MRISDWSSGVFSAVLTPADCLAEPGRLGRRGALCRVAADDQDRCLAASPAGDAVPQLCRGRVAPVAGTGGADGGQWRRQDQSAGGSVLPVARARPPRSEEHTSELQSLMRISYAVLRLKKKKSARMQLSPSGTYHIHKSSS